MNLTSQKRLEHTDNIQSPSNLKLDLNSDLTTINWAKKK